MKRLILMRHAKSRWDSPGIEDHARPLNGRGRSSARLMGNWLRAHDFLPDQALVSDARRTRETFAGLGIACDTAFLPALYLAGQEQMLRILRQATGEVVLMLGHNPGIGWLAQDLVAAPPPHPRFYDYPTCATLVADFDIDSWDALASGSGQVVSFVVPRELTG